MVLALVGGVDGDHCTLVETLSAGSRWPSEEGGQTIDENPRGFLSMIIEDYCTTRTTYQQADQYSTTPSSAIPPVDLLSINNPT